MLSLHYYIIHYMHNCSAEDSLFAQIEIKKIKKPVTIETKFVRNYHYTYSFRIYLYNEATKIYQVAMNQIAAFDFLQKQLLEENPDLTIIARNQIPSYLTTKNKPTHY